MKTVLSNNYILLEVSIKYYFYFLDNIWKFIPGQRHEQFVCSVRKVVTGVLNGNLLDIYRWIVAGNVCTFVKAHTFPLTSRSFKAEGLFEILNTFLLITMCYSELTNANKTKVNALRNPKVWCNEECWIRQKLSLGTIDGTCLYNIT